MFAFKYILLFLIMVNPGQLASDIIDVVVGAPEGVPVMVSNALEKQLQKGVTKGVEAGVAGAIKATGRLAERAGDWYDWATDTSVPNMLTTEHPLYASSRATSSIQHARGRSAHENWSGRMPYAGPRSFLGQRRGYDSKYRGITVGERKFFDQTVNSSTPVPTAGEILNSGSLVNIAQGATEITRVGRKAVIRNINWRYHLFIGTGTNFGLANAHVRMILYWDKQANKATAAVLDILETAEWESFRNLANGNRFEILYDKVIDMYCTAAAGNGSSNDFMGVFERGEYFKKCEIPIEYTSTTGAIGEITSNNIGVLMIADVATAVCHGKMRLRFTDS